MKKPSTEDALEITLAELGRLEAQNEQLVALLRDRPDYRAIEDKTDRYRQWSLKVEQVLAGAPSA